MTTDEFEKLLEEVTERLGNDIRGDEKLHEAKAFEKHVLDVLTEIANGRNIKISPSFHPHAFPDITANGFGVEVKTTVKDNWLSVGNSIFEGMRDPSTQKIYVVFGKMGGMPSVRWGRYEERITHVRISHAPRFVLEMDRDSSLFSHMKISYDDFAKLSPEEKMQHVRDYSRNRLKTGERLWWLEDLPEAHTLPMAVRMYMEESKEEKVRYRAEAALLCPEIVKPARSKNKYDGAALFLLTYYGIFCPQTRDLFTAGSVVLNRDATRGGNYMLRALQGLESDMKEAAFRLEDALFVEYWGEAVAPERRIAEWLRKADSYAKGWKPSDQLFKNG